MALPSGSVLGAARADDLTAESTGDTDEDTEEAAESTRETAESTRNIAEDTEEAVESTGENAKRDFFFLLRRLCSNRQTNPEDTGTCYAKGFA